MKPGFKDLRAVGYQTDVPYVSLSNYCWSFNCPKPGAEVEFLNMTFQLMNSTATIVQIDADIEQSIDMVSNGSADITLVSARQTLDRMKKVDFTTPIGFVYYGYLVREIPELAVADYIMRLFDYDTLAILISFGLIIGALLYLYTWIFGLRVRSLLDWMFISCSGIIHQFMFRISSPICALVLIGFWLLCCLVIITYYEAKLKSFLLLSHHRGTIFNTLDGVLEAAEHKGWTLVIQERGYTPYLYCNPSQCARLDRLKSRINFIGADDDANLLLGQDKHVGFSALASDLAETDITYFDYHSKILFVRDKIMAPEYLAYAVNKNVKGLREKFNRAVAYTKSGYGTVRSRYIASFPSYNSVTSQSQTITVLQTSHFIQLYKFCFIFYGIAIIVFILEIIFHRMTKNFTFFGHSYNYHLSGFEWRFARPKWIHFPRRNTVILPLSKSYSPDNERRVTVC
ncbi:uncharacterized protein CELE_T25E4.2 [Caenorhabditis elegans]|uniref:Uncharacterized protein T25E4.2 n=1 Tax=Caenorhabditis elegans TaxID=6239 RepID=YR02_CAEEL|nr:Uncharacterized protein CELE_T25E4.2 [Caenorhabditis elegans]Q10015.3 RecName: Full=Uncharacterized protein T25E4.2 [Caenorhabditis elegans]CCD64854.2 Uncharacterized protein CELE_T25E4.2 [Caenorhabditis elegans]